jgi:hypothetical protein
MKYNKLNKLKNGIVFEGKFYEFETIEYKNLMLIEGKKKENAGTLLDYVSQIETINPDNITNCN